MKRKSSLSRLIINIDGASKGNPGKSGIGVVVADAMGNEIKRIKEYIGVATNNTAEYTALVYGLQEALILGAETVTVLSDSELLVRQVNGEYAVRSENLKNFMKQVEHLRSGFSELKVQFIPREHNREADSLASMAVEDNK